ncbi:hypothetical protein [Treponema sp.]|uniref:hypothetical protein n=1 Tax=Treponema sp. TaxID=166 RepID=UPI0038904E27
MNCKICGKEFTTNHHNKLTCSKECSDRNKNDRYKMMTSEKKQELREYYESRYQPKSICRICGKVVEQAVLSTRRTSKRYHDDCVIKDCLATIYAGKAISKSQQLRLYSRGYTIKELKEEFINGKDEI